MPDTCTNCDDRKCMSCVLRQVHQNCVDDCPTCCRWVNGYMTLTVPLDGVGWGSTAEEKSEALTAFMERVMDALPDDLKYVGSGKWRNVQAGNPIDGHHHEYVGRRCIHCGYQSSEPPYPLAKPNSPFGL